jgi:hypothetical protein
MPREVIALLVAAILSSLVVALAVRSLLAGPHNWLARLMLPFLWLISSKYRGGYNEFTRERYLKLRHWVVLWVGVFLICLMGFTLIYRPTQ